MSEVRTIRAGHQVSVLARGDEVEGTTVASELAIVLGGPGSYVFIEGTRDELVEMVRYMRLHLAG